MWLAESLTPGRHQKGEFDMKTIIRRVSSSTAAMAVITVVVTVGGAGVKF